VQNTKRTEKHVTAKGTVKIHIVIEIMIFRNGLTGILQNDGFF